jgi:hypothetical protein
LVVAPSDVETVVYNMAGITAGHQAADPLDDDPDNAENELLATGGFSLIQYVASPGDAGARDTVTHPVASIELQDFTPPAVSGPLVPLGAALRLVDGYNLSVRANERRVFVRAGLALGVGYNVVPELDGLIVPFDRADLCIKELANAIPDADGVVRLVGGNRVSVVDSPGTHTVYVVVNAR